MIGEVRAGDGRGESTENRFAIQTDKPNVKVSWQVTGVRKDAYASMYPMAVEEDKEGEERGTYLHPEAFGQPEERGEGYAREQALRSHLEEMLEEQPLQTEEEATR